MTDPEGRLSPETFERLIARAIELDEQGGERLDAARARSIAEELGISEAAWNEAMRERRLALRVPKAKPEPSIGPWSSLRVALAGLAAGGLTGMATAAFNGGDLALGSALVLTAIAFVAHRTLRTPMWRAQLELGMWWITVPIGIMLGHGELLNDPLWFAALAWVGSACVGGAVAGLRRRIAQRSEGIVAHTA